jgi:hypothetical protein
LIKLRLYTRLLLLKLLPALIAQLFRAGRARKRQRLFDVFRTEVFIKLSNARFQRGLFRFDVTYLRAQGFKALLRVRSFLRGNYDSARQ